MSMIKYQFGNIDTASGDIRSTSARIGSELEDLKRQIQPMTSTWEGDSSAAYQQAQAQWDQAAAELNSILEMVAVTLGNGNESMNDINRRAAASWQ